MTPTLAEPLDVELKGLMTSHPQIAASAKNLESAEAGIKRSFGAFLPQVTFSGDTGIEHDNNLTTRARGKPDYMHQTRGTAVTMTSNLFDGGLRSANSAVSVVQKDVAGGSLDGTKQATISEGIVAYVNVLRQARLVELAATSEANIKRQLGLENDRAEKGSGMAVDVLQAKTRLQLAKEKRVAYEGAMADAISRYIQVYDHLPEVATMEMPKPPLGILPASADESVEVTLKENQTLVNSGRQIEIAREKRDSATAAYWPVINAIAEHNYSANKGAELGPVRTYMMQVKATWTLFDGFSTQAAVQQAALEYGISQDNEITARRKSTEATRLAWQALDTARKRAEVLSNAKDIAQRVFESRTKMREFGKETVINVLDAENETYNTRIAHTSAEADALLATYQLLFAIGRLTIDNVTAVTTPSNTEPAVLDQPTLAEPVAVESEGSESAPGEPVPNPAPVSPPEAPSDGSEDISQIN